MVVHRNGNVLTTTGNDGSHTDAIGGKGGGTYTYKVCDGGTAICSLEVSASF